MITDKLRELLMEIIMDLYPEYLDDDYPDLYDLHIDEAKEEVIKLLKEL